MILHEAARVGRRSIGAVQFVFEHAQHRRLLAMVVSGVGYSADGTLVAKN